MIRLQRCNPWPRPCENLGQAADRRHRFGREDHDQRSHRACAQPRFRVLKSEGNFNNHFGLPLMLLNLEPEHDVAVIEMGMSHAGEIRALAKIAQPEIGVVTNVAPVHLEFFDSLAGIARAKYELIESLPATGTAMLNADDEYVSQFGRDFKGKVVTLWDLRDRRHSSRDIAITAERRARVSMSSWRCARNMRRFPLVGEHNILNALAAVAVGLAARD